MTERELLKHAFEESDTLFKLLAGQRTRRVFKGGSKDISGVEIHGGTGRKLAFEGERFEPGPTALTRTPDGPNSAAAVRTSYTMPALVIA